MDPDLIDPESIGKLQDELLEQDNVTMVSIDDVVSIFTKTLFNPWGCWVFAIYYLLRDFGGMLGFQDAYIADECWYGIYFALAVNSVYLFAYLNGVLAVGKPRSSLCKETGTVVITGGSSGLGEKVAGILGVSGYRVVVLDVNPPQTVIPNVEFIRCDVADHNQVKQASETITGKVTVLINNAGIVPGKQSILEIDDLELDRTISINLKSHFYTTQAFLPKMITNRFGHIVTISSVLGTVGAGRAAAYCATKGAVNQFHDSLTHEIKQYGIRTLLVTPGQLNTMMFHGVKTPSEFLAPLVNPTDLAHEIVRRLERGSGGVMSTPLYASLLSYVKLLVPSSLFEMFRSGVGMDRAMDTFVGTN